MLRLVPTVLITHSSPRPHKDSRVTTLGHSTGGRNYDVKGLIVAATIVLKSFSFFR